MFLLHLPCLYMFPHPQQGMCLPASDPELSGPYHKWISVRLVSKRGTELMKCRHSFFSYRGPVGRLQKKLNHFPCEYNLKLKL